MAYYKKRRSPVYRRRKKTMYKRKRKVYSSKSRDLITFRPTNQNPFPQRYRTKFVCEGTYALGAVTYTNRSINVKMNSLNLPFSPALGGSGAITYAGPLTAATLNPTGFSSLVTAVGNPAPFTSFRVYSSKIEVNCLPESVGDVMQVVILPYTTNHAGFNDDVYAAQSQPFAKTRWVNGNSIGTTGNALKNYISVKKFFGVTGRAIQDDITPYSTGSAGTDPSNLILWRVLLNNADGAANLQPGSCRVKITYYVELFWQSEQQLPIS